MPRHTIKTCEPFRAWNRLESRPRAYDFDRALKSEIHDPLWMLTRQWQFGEFKGEDTGSPVFAKVLVGTTKIAGYQAYQGEVEDYSDELPLEAVVERQPFTLGYKDRLRTGNYWLKLLRWHGNRYNEEKGAGEPAFEEPVYKEILLREFPLQVAAVDATSAESLIQSAQLAGNHRLMNLLASVAGRTPDGLSLYRSAQTDKNQFTALIIQDDGHAAFIQAAVDAFLEWFGGQYPEIPASGGAWNASQLEYQFQCSLPEKTGADTELAADEYHTGRLDWFAFDVETAGNGRNAPRRSDKTAKEGTIGERVISFIPSPASFGGMPNNRFWEFEDGQVDLGDINAETTDISKIVVVEYATMYGNNWFLIPYPVETGTLSAAQGIVVTDVFGQKTYVEPAIQGESDDWQGWGLFNLTTWDPGKTRAVAADTRILIPPVAPKVQESEPVEEVVFLRDETANLVWAVERRIDGLLGAGMDGHKAAAELANFLQAALPKPETAVAEGAVLKYVLSNTVPENWIPFIAVHLNGENRAVRLQRASMPRPVNGETLAVRPRTQLLRHGFIYEPATETAPYVNPAANLQKAPYFIHEEEVPRAGVTVKGTFQRARWYQGKIVQWYGYKKMLGKGEGGSGLRFDLVEYV